MSRRNGGDPTGITPHRSVTALLLLDLISDFEFEDGEQVFRRALPVARRIEALKARAARKGIPVIYVNDQVGQWRSDFPELVRRCKESDCRGAPIVRLLEPKPNDYCVLKPKHSGFFETPLETLLRYIGAKKLIITGVSSSQCVLFTANDAYVRDFELAIPRDCVAARTTSETRLALSYFESVLKADTRPASRLRLS
jgi:nicotinamidase-related amidase